MECQSIINLLSPYLDGELESSKAEIVREHLIYCHRCRDELLVLEEISSVLQELPEISPPSDFHAGLQAELTKLTTAAAAETVKQKASPLRNFVYGTWSKAAAFAAVLILTLGITVLWNSEGLDIRIKPDRVSYDALSETSQSGQAVPSESETLEKKHSVEPGSSNLIEASDSVQSGVKNKSVDKQKESLQRNYTQDKESKIIASEFPRETGAMKIQSEPEKGVKPGVIPPEVTRARDPGMYGRGVPLGAGMDPKIAADTPEEKAQGEQLLGQVQAPPEFMKMQLKVEDIENAIAEILILSQNNNASIEILQNKVLINVSAENFDPLAEQIKSLGQVTGKEFTVPEFTEPEFTVQEFTEQGLTDQKLNTEQLSLEKQIFTIYLELN